MKEIEINIWGKPGCELPNGKLCTACCVLPEIELEGTYVSLAKPAHSPCTRLTDKGCSLHSSNRKPDACKGWHCSKANLGGKLDLIAQSLSLGQVSEKEAVSSASELVDDNVGGKNMEFYLNTSVLSRSVELSRITYPRELVERDLDET